MSCRHFISCRRELPFSYVDLLAGRGNDRNRVLLTIPLKESTRVRCLGGGALKSMVLQMDFESWTCRHHAFADKKAPGRKLKNAGDAGCRGSKHSLHRKPVCAKTRKQSGALQSFPALRSALRELLIRAAFLTDRTCGKNRNGDDWQQRVRALC